MRVPAIVPNYYNTANDHVCAKLLWTQIPATAPIFHISTFIRAPKKSPYRHAIVHCPKFGVCALVHLHRTVSRCKRMGIPSFGYHTRVYIIISYIRKILQYILVTGTLVTGTFELQSTKSRVPTFPRQNVFVIGTLVTGTPRYRHTKKPFCACNEL